MNKGISLAIAAAAVLMVGCSSSDVTELSVGTYNGKFVDAAVQGLTWTCNNGSKTDVTDINGTFGPCPIDGIVYFSLGKTAVGSFKSTAAMGIADSIITPTIIQDQVAGADTATKIAILLQSMDSDGNASNGISITPAAITALDTQNPKHYDITDISVTVADVSTTMDAVVQIVDPSGTSGMNVVTEAEANDHLDSTEAAIEDGSIAAPTQPEQPGDETGATGGTN